MIIREGDCRAVLATLAAGSFDGCVTDPPYHLTANKPGGTGEASLNLASPAGRSRIGTGGGFMGKQWDGGDVAFQPDTWRAVHRVLKPGAHLVAFGGTRTWHRLACAIEDAGFELRDTLCWLYGSGFPKHRNALKPAFEPIILARKPLIGAVVANVLQHGTGGINIDACRVEYTPGGRPSDSCWSKKAKSGDKSGSSVFGKYTTTNKTIAEKEHSAGRWPANVCHDGSTEVEAAFAAFGEVGGGSLGSTRGKGRAIYGGGLDNDTGQSVGFGDSGSASRFFYTAKADKADRADSKHPTVKPVELMRWLVRLITQPGGRIIDPFAGSGTTGEAAMLEGFDATLIELSAEHVADIRHRIKRWSGEDAPLFAAN